MASVPPTVAGPAGGTGVAGDRWQPGKGFMSICEENRSQDEVYTRVKMMKKISVRVDEKGEM